MTGFQYGGRNLIVRYGVLVFCVMGLFACKGNKPATDPAGAVVKDDKSVSNSTETTPVKRGIFVPNLQGRPIPVISMYVEEYGPWILPQNFEWHPVLLSVWSNGDIIYSHDYLKGGRPYNSAKVSPQQVESFLTSLSSSELWKKFPKGYSIYGPDSSFITLVVIHHGKALELSSWDELFEASGKSVGTARGIRFLEGKTAQEVLAEQPQEYRDFRQLWDMIRSGAKALIPKEGIETDPNWIDDYWPSVGR
jgi:hypothetical protein